MTVNENENIELLLSLTRCLVERQIVHTQFGTVTIPATASKNGIQIGQGSCKAVILYLNNLVLNDQANTQTAANLAQIYYGDAQYQFRELQRGNSSDILFCKDLSEIYVRGNGIANQVQVTIYLGDGDVVNITA